MARGRQPRPVTVLSVDAIGTPLGPRVRLGVEGVPIVMTVPEAHRVAQWLWDAAELAELDDLEQCHHCHDNPPEGHTCPACGRQHHEP